MLYNVKAGIIGLNPLGKVYAKLIKEHVKNLNLIGACGRTQEELLFAKNELSLEYVYSDERSLFENHDIDAIFVFSETKLKPHHVIQAINSGKHVFMLSPLALNVEDAEAVYKAAESRPSQKVLAGSLVRSVPVLQSLKDTIVAGEIGTIQHVSVDASFVNSLNKQYSKPTGSIFLDSTMDEIDLAQWLIDEPLQKVNVRNLKDTILCHAETNKGITLDLILQPKLKKVESYLNVYGNAGQITLSNANSRSFKLFKKDGTKEDVFIDTAQKFMFAEYLQLHHFTECILGNVKNKLKVNHALQTMKLAVAFEKSKVLEQAIEI